MSWRDGSVGQVLPLQTGGPSVLPRTQVKSQAWHVMCNPRTGEMEMHRSLGLLAGQPSLLSKL